MYRTWKKNSDDKFYKHEINVTQEISLKLKTKGWQEQHAAKLLTGYIKILKHKIKSSTRYQHSIKLNEQT